MAEAKLLSTFTDAMLMTYLLAGGLVVYRAFTNHQRASELTKLDSDVDEQGLSYTPSQALKQQHNPEKCVMVTGVLQGGQIESKQKIFDFDDEYFIQHKVTGKLWLADGKDRIEI
jgi:hypothetical protein